MTTETISDLRSEVGAWLDENWQPGTDPKSFVEAVVDAGWAVPSWPPAALGRGLDSDSSAIVHEEFVRRRAPGSGQDRTNLWAGTLVSYGRPELQQQLLRDLLLGRVTMCLLYSEPGAGSDLASLRTTAVRDGDEWIVNGQKVWTSGAKTAEYGMLIARTDWDVSKHAGISFFWLPMKQPGVEVRPLRQATGDARFNEVFLTDARVADANLLGDVNQGWQVLQRALMYERAVMGSSMVERKRRPAPGIGPDTATGAASASADESDDDTDVAGPPPDVSLVDLARSVGKHTDPATRQRLARLHCLVQVNRWNTQRGKDAASQGIASPVVSLGKLAMSTILHSAGSLETELLGAEGMLGGTASPRSAMATYSLLNAFFTSIGGGTDQIQRNIIGERILGLGKEPEVDRHIAFRDVPASGSPRPV